MSQSRSKKYFQSNTGKKNIPIQTKEEVGKSSDNKIDQDFPNFPHAQSAPDIISPKTREQKKTAAVNIKDGEKRSTNEQNSDGSGGAFNATEEVKE